MAKAEGVIIVRFPPPVPKDLGLDLRRAIRSILASTDECSASNTGALSGPPGWALDIRINKSPRLAESAAAVAQLLRERNLETTMEVSERRGPLTIDLLAGDWAVVKKMSFPEGTAASADLYVKIPGVKDCSRETAAALSAAALPHGRVTYACQLETLNATIVVDDACNATACLEALRSFATTHPEIRLDLCLQSRPIVEPSTHFRN